MDAHDAEKLNHVVSAWAFEEAAEYAIADERNDETARIDAVFDALGVYIIRLILSDRQAVATAFEAYQQSQAERGRQPGMHTFIITLICHVIENAGEWREETAESDIAYVKSIIDTKWVKLTTQTHQEKPDGSNDAT